MAVPMGLRERKALISFIQAVFGFPSSDAYIAVGGSRRGGKKYNESMKIPAANSITAGISLSKLGLLVSGPPQ